MGELLKLILDDNLAGEFLATEAAEAEEFFAGDGCLGACVSFSGGSGARDFLGELREVVEGLVVDLGGCQRGVFFSSSFLVTQKKRKFSYLFND